MNSPKKKYGDDWVAWFLVLLTAFFISLAGSIILTSANVWAASESKRTVTTQEIKESAENYLVSHLGWDPESMDVAVSYDGKDLILPEGELMLDFGMPNNSRRVGRIPLTVQVKVNDKFIKRLRMNATVAVIRDVIRTINSVQRKTIIGKSDVIVDRVRTERVLKDIPTQLDKVIGQEATRNLQIGKIIKFRDFKKVPLVKRGSRVIILATKGPMKITAPGAVREEGFKNSVVKVVNLETKKTIYAEVLSANTVKVRF